MRLSVVCYDCACPVCDLCLDAAAGVLSLRTMLLSGACAPQLRSASLAHGRCRRCYRGSRRLAAQAPLSPPPAMPSTCDGRVVTGLSQIAHQYEAILLDQFGVLHDGQQPYPAAIHAVQQLHAAGAKIIILSNSSRRSSGTIGKLAKMGFQAEWFAGAVTSGEMTHQYLVTRPTPWWKQLGTRCLHLTWATRGAISLDGLGLEVVSKPEDAQFILAHGTEALGQPDGSVAAASLSDMEALLQRCSQLGGRPMVVANPDLVTVDGPNLVVMPGTLAKYYGQQGGQVQLMGKPDPLIYQAAQQMLPGVAVSKWLAIGDSLEHDIAGAAAAGMDSLFVAAGIHAKDVGYVQLARQPNQQQQVPGSAAADTGGSPLAGPAEKEVTQGGLGTWHTQRLQALLQQYEQLPTYTTAALSW